VRRFNFLAFADFETPTTRMQYNPDVTVRSRGVMEKCSYCIQRVRQAEIGADVEGRRVVDGEVVTACQAACPTRAISFGDMNDSSSEVKRWKDSPLHYSLLADLNTQPRTTYLAALRNPHPDFKEDPK
jgi:Fe-S-cluster-containing dehydrogenase component